MSQIIQGDALTELKKLPRGSVDCCVTSPPYYGLRDYGIVGQIGLEPTPEAYVAKQVEVFREVRRVLKDEGTLWLNLGDSFCSQGGPQVTQTLNKNRVGGSDTQNAGKSRSVIDGLKPKDLIGIPWMVAFALRADGWWLRSDIIWQKLNPMPESVQDRPTKSHEYIFLLSKSEVYFYDAEAIKEDAVSTKPSGNGFNGRQGGSSRVGPQSGGEGSTDKWQPGAKRNTRSVWTFPTHPYKEAHFATFPEVLVDPCVLAGTSEKGNCPACGKPWIRQMKRTAVPDVTAKGSKFDSGKTGINGLGRVQPGERFLKVDAGWRPSCSCILDCAWPAPTRPVVLDPFFGAGTVGVVSKKLGREFIGIELNPDYCKMARKRIDAVPIQRKLTYI